MEKIKIALVITRLDRGGAPDLLLSIINHLDPNRYDISLISGLTLHPLSGIQEISQKNIKLIFVPCLRREINPLLDIKACFKLYRIFKEERFDIVHTHTAKAGVLGRITARLAGIKKIAHLPHGHNFYGYFGPLRTKLATILERFIAHFTDRLIVLTELEKQDFLKFKVGKISKIVVINSGLNLDRYRQAVIDRVKVKEEFSVQENEFLVGMIGRLEPVKGPQYFVEASTLVCKEFPQTKFLVAGDGRLKPELEFQARRLGVYDRFIFTGWREDIPEILPILDILVLPSLNEAVGRILIEAGACGIPVIASRVGGIPEIVKDNQTGVLVAAGDPPRLAEAIILLLKDRERRLRMGENARAWVDGKFSAENMADKFAKVYEELVKE